MTAARGQPASKVKSVLEMEIRADNPERSGMLRAVVETTDGGLGRVATLSLDAQGGGSVSLRVSRQRVGEMIAFLRAVSEALR